MKTKTISSILRRKTNSWLRSLPKELAEKVSDQIVVTGGCIVSMLLGEKINDFDLYFRTQDATASIAAYYLEKFKTNHPNFQGTLKKEGARVTIHIPSDGVASDSEELEEQELDVLELDDVKKTKEELEKYRPVFLSANAITLSDKIQIVIRFWGNPEEIHENYDFIHCTCYWTSKDGRLVLPNEALVSILTRELRYVGNLYPVCSIIRTRKFINRGWTITAGQFIKMAFQVSCLDLQDIAVLQEQLTGVDQLYMQRLISACQEKVASGERIDTNWLCMVIDRIF